METYPIEGRKTVKRALKQEKRMPIGNRAADPTSEINVR
jgi:hypothetical protein